MIRNKDINRKQEIDISGPDGNAFVLLGIAAKFAKDLKYSKKQQAELLLEMKKSNYDNLIKVFDNHFGDYVDLVR